MTENELQNLNVDLLRRTRDDLQGKLDDPNSGLEDLQFSFIDPTTGIETTPPDKRAYFQEQVDRLNDKIRMWENWNNTGRQKQQTAHTQTPPGGNVNTQQTYQPPSYGAPGGVGGNIGILRSILPSIGGDIQAVHQKAVEYMKTWDKFGKQWFVLPLDKNSPQFTMLNAQGARLVYSYIVVLLIDQDQSTGIKTVYTHPILIKSSGDIAAAVRQSPELFKSVENIIGPYISNIDRIPQVAFQRLVEKFMHETFPETAPVAAGGRGQAFNLTQAGWQSMDAEISSAAPGSAQQSKFEHQLINAHMACRTRWTIVNRVEASLAEIQNDGFTATIQVTPYQTININGQLKRADFRITFTSGEQRRQGGGIVVNQGGAVSNTIDVFGYVDYSRIERVDERHNNKRLMLQPTVVITAIEQELPSLGANLLAIGLMSEICQEYQWLNLIGVTIGKEQHHDYAAIAADVMKRNGTLPSGGKLDYTNINDVRQMLAHISPAIAMIRLQVPVENTSNAALHTFVMSVFNPPRPYNQNNQEEQRQEARAQQDVIAAQQAVAFSANFLTHGTLANIVSNVTGWSLFDKQWYGYKADGFYPGPSGVQTSAELMDTLGLMTIIHRTTNEADKLYINDNEPGGTLRDYDMALQTPLPALPNKFFGALNAAMGNSLIFTGMQYVIWVNPQALGEFRKALAAANIRLTRTGFSNFGQPMAYTANMLGSYIGETSLGTSAFASGMRDTGSFGLGIVAPLL